MTRAAGVACAALWLAGCATPVRVVELDVPVARASRLPPYLNTLDLADDTRPQGGREGRAGRRLSAGLRRRLETAGIQVLRDPGALLPRIGGRLTVVVEEASAGPARGRLVARYAFSGAGGEAFEDRVAVGWSADQDPVERERRSLAVERNLPRPQPPGEDEVLVRLVDRWCEACTDLLPRIEVRRARWLDAGAEFRPALQAAGRGELARARQMLLWLEPRSEPEILAREYDLALLSHLAGQAGRAREHLERARRVGRHPLCSELEAALR